MNNLKIFTKNIESEAMNQISLLLKQEPFKDCKVRIMPDVHAGKGCVIGFTANLGDKVIPNIVGVDIGCGILTVNLGKQKLNLKKLDKIVKNSIPSGHGIHDSKLFEMEKIKDLYCLKYLKDTDRFERAIGTLGGGNHFIEVDADKQDSKYLIIHSGSRNMGKQVAEYYQNLAINLCNDKKETILKDQKSEIEKSASKLEKEYQINKCSLPRELCYLQGEHREMYLHDMNICQEYAVKNRVKIAQIIFKNYFGIKDPLYYNNDNLAEDNFHTVHNYIDIKSNIVRKGAISAKENERLLIPINMRDGCIMGVGKGNTDWNESAPHGAGRIMSRMQAKKTLNLNQFKESMNGIYSTSICKSTIDEAPFVYKPLEEIVENIKDTVEIEKIIKPIYNFKASN